MATRTVADIRADAKWRVAFDARDVKILLDLVTALQDRILSPPTIELTSDDEEALPLLREVKPLLEMIYEMAVEHGVESHAIPNAIHRIKTYLDKWDKTP